mmetsp:Transcript_31225/g.100814  ORF Transcript_31225/g.100814 Transcript_31225/m.100814 type:complete len:276 (+) Transcript_31225:1105-1932(+)
MSEAAAQAQEALQPYGLLLEHGSILRVAAAMPAALRVEREARHAANIDSARQLHHAAVVRVVRGGGGEAAVGGGSSGMPVVARRVAGHRAEGRRQGRRGRRRRRRQGVLLLRRRLSLELRLEHGQLLLKPEVLHLKHLLLEPGSGRGGGHVLLRRRALRAVEHGHVRHQHGGELLVRPLALLRVEQRLGVAVRCAAGRRGRRRLRGSDSGGERRLLLEEGEPLLLLPPRLQLHLKLLLLLRGELVPLLLQGREQVVRLLLQLRQLSGNGLLRRLR